MKPIKTSSYLFVFIISLFLTGCTDGRQQSERDFNIILICVDTLRADHLHCYGYERETSPRIDAFAEKSIFFEYAFCPIPKTSSSFASMLTGLHPYVHKTKPNLGLLEEKYITLPEILKLKGYETAAVVDNVNLSKRFAFNQGFDSYTEVWNEIVEKAESTPFITREVLSFLKAERAKPFFLWVNYIETHTPYIPPRQYVEEYPPGRDIRTIEKKIIRNHMKKEIEEKAIFHEGHYIARYDGAVRYVDAEIGKIIDAFNTLGLDKNTVLIFTSDHGEDLGERNFFFDHGPLTSTAASRVPLIVYIPGEKPRRIKTPVSIMDIYPTILNFSGLHPPYSLQGIDLLRAQEKRLLFLVGWLGTHGVVQDKYQYISVYPEISHKLPLAPHHFYDIVVDPYEKKNLYGSNKAEARRMHEAYIAFGKKHGYMKRNKSTPKKKSLTKKELNKLRALGYLK